MGQPIVVVEKPSVANPGMVRFETNRPLTGMSHERYLSGTEVRGDRPSDELARRLLAHGGVEAVHMNGSVVTVDLAKGHGSDGLRQVIEGLFIHYVPESAEALEDVVEDADQPTSEGELVEQELAAEGTAPAPAAAPSQPSGDAEVLPDAEATPAGAEADAAEAEAASEDTPAEAGAEETPVEAGAEETPESAS
ncbi:hypothetical protein PO878_06280 [Iamia majanohamensis]|uniref:Uncharacterized protein n=1 Tax=Iamia majanohamensis TaxID=467976 RepID=A0AAF0BX66_9ACTN|nr:hypothetical protein [Iamia majanohamensis]WCO68334.1 hypothetical protein PO878_06280 [Iamia majanohamensis]